MPVRLVINSLDFALNAETHRDNIAISELERLQDHLADDRGELQYSITGSRDRNGNPILLVAVRGIISLRCQRCLGELAYALDVFNELLLAKDEKELLRLDEAESVECILARRDMDVLALIEDEIILSLPISPCHPEGECTIVELGGHAAAGNKPLYTALAALKKFH